MLSLVDTQNVHTILLNKKLNLNIQVNGREQVCALGLKMQMYLQPNLKYRSTPDVYSLPSLSRIVFYCGFYKSHDFSHMAPPPDCLR